MILIAKRKNDMAIIMIDSVKNFYDYSVYEYELNRNINNNDCLFASKNLGSLWDDLGKEMENEDEIEIGEVDCGTDKDVCSKVDIHSYPTFKVFYDGEEVARYQGNYPSVKYMGFIGFY
jgi:hypothetical protein